ncbi:Protein containing transglutaminase-like domain, putative cysteine protease [invertebrate metagenome]|uniref:Protein containing transglutaminase-like domain, putative cysteine protease n=1 Tax=invertebrate metagenome TaxID=1711999 RepID=A0A484H5Q3_9ZZZZ
MTVTYHSRHVTVYNYALPVTVSHHAAHLAPRALPTQTIHSSMLRVQPEPAHRSTRTDYFGNHVFFFTLEETHRSLKVESLCKVTLSAPVRPPADSTLPWEQVRDRLARDLSPDTLEAHQYGFDSSFVVTSAAVEDYAKPSFPPGRPVLAAVVDLMHRIHRDFTYDPQATTIATPLVEVLRHRRGVCQDFAHLQIACCRTMGLAARYVSGYVHTYRATSPTGTDGQPTRLIGADASHAWLAIYVPAVGWVDLDPTNDTMPSVEHITIAWGRDYDDVSPLKGVVMGGGKHSLRVEVSVTLCPTP